jgi:hypothetical protein
MSGKLAKKDKKRKDGLFFPQPPTETTLAREANLNRNNQADSRAAFRQLTQNR